MPSLLDKLAKDPPRTVVRRIVAIDPGLDLVGWACVQAEGTSPLTAPVRFSQLFLGLMQAKEEGLSPLQQGQHTIRELSRLLGVYINASQVLAVEAQQLYYKDDEGRDEIVAKGNDLLRLAQVTGAVQAMAFVNRMQVLSYLPAQWKGQRKKRPMHDEAANQLKGVPVKASVLRGSVPGRLAEPDVIDQPTLDVDKLPKRMHHGLDALCLAMFAANQIFRRG